MDRYLGSLACVDSLRDALYHSVKEGESRLSDNYTVINLVLERAQVHFLDKTGVNLSHAIGCVLNNVCLTSHCIG